jgi:hypothetical protein
VWDEKLFEGYWGVFWAAEEDKKKPDRSGFF